MSTRRKPPPPKQPPRATTVTDVAREAGVSVASVSRVVNGHTNVTPETRRRIEEVVARLRYVPHTAARSLATKRTHVIGVLLPDLYGGFFSELIRGIDAAARALHLHLLLSSSHGDAAEMAAAIRAMHGRVEGLLILAPQLDAASLGALDPITPAVFMNSRGAPGASASLSIDSYGGARAMVRHLAACGHRSIAHVTGPADNFDSHERERGYRDELAASLPRARARVIRGDFTEASGYAAGSALGAAGGRPAAVFAANDMMALGCLAAFDAAGLAVPRDIALAGFDDIPLASYVRPALTTMRVHIVELGRGAMNQLAAVIAAPDAAPLFATTFEPELVIRDSCGSTARNGGPDGDDPHGTEPRTRTAPPPKRHRKR